MFQNPAQRELHTRVGGWLRELFGEGARPRDEAPAFLVTVGSAVAQVTISPWQNEEAVVHVRAGVVEDVDVTHDLALFLLERNGEMRIGAFAIDPGGSVFLEYTLLGAGSDKAGLRAAVQAVVSTAEKSDDIIVSRWGGVKALER